MSLRAIGRMVGKSHTTIRAWIDRLGPELTAPEIHLRPVFPKDVTIPLACATCDDVHPGLPCPADPREVCMVNEHHCKTTFTGDSMAARVEEDGQAHPTSYMPDPDLKGGLGSAHTKP